MRLMRDEKSFEIFAINGHFNRKFGADPVGNISDRNIESSKIVRISIEKEI